MAYYVALRLFKWPPMNRNAAFPPRLPDKSQSAVLAVVAKKPNDGPDSTHAATLSWTGLNYTVPNPDGGGTKPLISDVYGYAAPGMLVRRMPSPPA